jgi:hypothetical protein
MRPFLKESETSARQSIADRWIGKELVYNTLALAPGTFGTSGLPSCDKSGMLTNALRWEGANW